MSHSQRRLPQDPQVRALVQAMGQRSFSRRSVLSTAGALGLTGLLAACGTGGSKDTKTEAVVTDLSESDQSVNWANWTLYLDYDDKKKTYPTLDAFTKKTGIKVNYAEDIDGNDSYYGKVQGAA